MIGKRPHRLPWLLISLVLTTVAVVPLAYWLTPLAVRRHLLGKLTSAELDQRQRGLNYIMRHARQQRRVLEGALQHAARARQRGDNHNFTQIVNALQTTGTWRRQRIPDALWLHWINILGNDPAPESRILAAQQLASLHDLASDRRLVDALAVWFDDEHQRVRYHVLLAAAELAGVAQDRNVYAELIVKATLDPVPSIARQGWIFAGLLRLTDMTADGSSTLLSPSPEVDQARLWAMNRLDPQPVQAPPSILNATTNVPADDLVRQLALLDATPVGQRRIDIPAHWSDTLRLAAVAVTAAPEPAQLAGVFAAPVATIRDQACVIAARRFTVGQNKVLIATLLNDYSDNAKRSGAILAGLTGLQGQLLVTKMQHEDIWTVKQIHRLGLWMQGRLPELDKTVQGLLTRNDLPTTSILLAMLHNRHREALNTLLDPRSDEPQFSSTALNLPQTEGEAPISLKHLLVHYRWYHVLRHYLPADAPPLWLWADEHLQQFQIGVLRNWYLLHGQTDSARQRMR